MSDPAVAKPVLPPPIERYQQAGPFVRVLVFGLLGVFAAMVLDVLFGHPVDPKTPAAASGIIAVAGGAALAIERALEVFWNLVDQAAKNPSTPFGGAAQRLEYFAIQIKAAAKPAIDQAKQITDDLNGAASVAPHKFDEFKARVVALDSAVTDITQGATNVDAAMGMFKQTLDELNRILIAPEARASVVAASDAISSLDELVTKLDDDPGRRIMSLLAGTTIGVLVAGVLGLDVIRAAVLSGPSSVSVQAVLNSGESIGDWWSKIHGIGGLPWGMIATGIAIGLGSNPLHELVKAIQKYKQSR